MVQLLLLHFELFLRTRVADIIATTLWRAATIVYNDLRYSYNGWLIIVYGGSSLGEERGRQVVSQPESCSSAVREMKWTSRGVKDTLLNASVFNDCQAYPPPPPRSDKRQIHFLVVFEVRRKALWLYLSSECSTLLNRDCHWISGVKPVPLLRVWFEWGRGAAAPPPPLTSTRQNDYCLISWRKYNNFRDWWWDHSTNWDLS